MERTVWGWSFCLSLGLAQVELWTATWNDRLCGSQISRPPTRSILEAATTVQTNDSILGPGSRPHPPTSWERDGHRRLVLRRLKNLLPTFTEPANKVRPFADRLVTHEIESAVIRRTRQTTKLAEKWPRRHRDRGIRGFNDSSWLAKAAPGVYACLNFVTSTSDVLCKASTLALLNTVSCLGQHR